MKTKSILFAIVSLLFFHQNLISQDDKKLSFGAKVMLGGRYDDVRMCVASDAGVKGGMIADIMLLTKYQANPKLSIVFELPVMRPILFGAAFNMLQLEPQFIFEFRKSISEKSDLILGPGIGASFHYGPDYKSDMENRSESFFAVGPMASVLLGYGYTNSKNNSRVIGIRPFYIPLFPTDNNFESGMVLGGVVELHFYF